MAELTMSYSVDNDKKFSAAIDKAIKLGGDLRVPFGQISQDFYKSEQAIFKLGGPGQYPDFKGAKGKDGKTAYERYKESHSPARSAYPLLFFSGKLAASVLGPNNEGSINTIKKTSLEIGTEIEYGIYHQSDRARSKIPLRKFLFIGPEAKKFATSDQMGRLERWLGYMSDYIEDATKGFAE